MKDKLLNLLDYLVAFSKWALIAVAVGLIGGVVGSIFHLAIDGVTEFRGENGWLIYLLPVGGLVIAGLYHLCRKVGKVLVVKNPPANAGDTRDVGSIPELGRSPGGGHGNPLQYFCLGNPMNRKAWQTTIHGVMKSWKGENFDK